jgi:hypothetical protein
MQAVEHSQEKLTAALHAVPCQIHDVPDKILIFFCIALPMLLTPQYQLRVMSPLPGHARPRACLTPESNTRPET